VISAAEKMDDDQAVFRAGWSHFTQVNWMAQILLALVLGLYIAATQASRLRKRTELIEALLVESLQPLGSAKP
jgi:NhaP-type Na+/H+ and K+/H+ antiporter